MPSILGETHGSRIGDHPQAVPDRPPIVTP
jgi:hypothetical protein